MEALGFGLTFNEAKENIRNASKSLAPPLILENLKKLLNFLNSQAIRACFVNTQGDYLRFYHMIALDEAYLSSAFFTDECKVVASEILDVLKANSSIYSYEACFGNKHIAGIPVILKKVYKNERIQNLKEFEKPIDFAFKETWVRKTLQFVKSQRQKYNYPDMRGYEADYVYEWILRQSEEVELGDEYLWTPVWEAMNIFRLRYDYVVSLYSIQSSSYKHIQFDKCKKRTIPLNEHNSVQGNVTDKDKTNSIELSNRQQSSKEVLFKNEFVLQPPTTSKARNKYIRKKELAQSVSTDFIRWSFEKIYKFVKDDTEATLEIRNLNNREMEVLVCLLYYAPHKVATGLIFDEPCNDLLIKIHLCLRERRHFKLTPTNTKDWKSNSQTVIFRKVPHFSENHKQSSKEDKVELEEDEYDSSDEVLNNMFDDVLEELRLQGQKQAANTNNSRHDSLDVSEYQWEDEEFSTTSQEEVHDINKGIWFGDFRELRKPLSILEQMQSPSVSPDPAQVYTERTWMLPEKLWASPDENIVQNNRKVLEWVRNVPEWIRKSRDDSAERLLASLINTAKKTVVDKDDKLLQCDKDLRSTDEIPNKKTKLIDGPPAPLESEKAKSLLVPGAKCSKEVPIMKTKLIEGLSAPLESDKALRTTAPKTTQVLRYMKSKLIEGLSVPLESDKAMRMMRLMGWNGGALGVRGNGLIEPLNPILDLQKRVGLGHKTTKTGKAKLSKAEKKLNKAIRKANKAKKLAKEKERKKNKAAKNNTQIENEIVKNTNAAKFNKNGARDDIISISSSDNDLTNEIKSKVNIENNNTPVTLSDDNLRTADDDKLIDSDNDSESDYMFVDYTREDGSADKTVRIMFFIAVLDLVQTEKTYEFIWFPQKVSKSCEQHIQNTVKSFNERTEISSNCDRENLIMKTIFKEMDAHSDIVFTIECDQFDRRVMTLIKKTRGDESPNLLIPQLEKFVYTITHIVLDSSQYSFVSGLRKAKAARIIVNRLILYFAKSNLSNIVVKYNFFMNNPCRRFIDNIVSSLNRHILNETLFVAIGNTEYRVFKQIAAALNGFFLLVKYDNYNMKFNQMILVKVPIDKRCEACRKTLALSQTKDNMTSSNLDITKNKKVNNTVNKVDNSETDVAVMDPCKPFNDIMESIDEELVNISESDKIVESQLKGMTEQIVTKVIEEEAKEVVKNRLQSVDDIYTSKVIEDIVKSSNEEPKNTSATAEILESATKDTNNQIGFENKGVIINPLQCVNDMDTYEPFDDKVTSLNAKVKSLSEICLAKLGFSSVTSESLSKDNSVEVAIEVGNQITGKLNYNEKIDKNIIYKIEKPNSESNIKTYFVDDKKLQENSDQSIQIYDDINDQINKYFKDFDREQSDLQKISKHCESVNVSYQILNLNKDTNKNNEIIQINRHENITDDEKHIESAVSVEKSMQIITTNEVQKVLTRYFSRDEVQRFGNNANHISSKIKRTWKDDTTLCESLKEIKILDSNQDKQKSNEIVVISEKTKTAMPINENKFDIENKGTIKDKDKFDNLHCTCNKRHKPDENDVREYCKIYPNNDSASLYKSVPLFETVMTNTANYNLSLNNTKESSAKLNKELFQSVDKNKDYLNSMEDSNTTDMEIDKQEKKEVYVESNTDFNEKWPKRYTITLKSQDEITQDSATHIQKIIYNAVKTTQKSFLPCIECHGIQNKGIVYSCHNSKSFNWLHYQLSSYCNISEVIDVLNPTHIIELKVKIFIGIDVDLVFKNIKELYSEIRTDLWNVIQERVFDDCCVFTIKIDSKSLEVIKKNHFFLFIGFDRAEIRLVND